jgi:hypothetical protein
MVWQVGRFWRDFLQHFPELIDFLASVDSSTREHFKESVINSLYDEYYDTREGSSKQLNDFIRHRWLQPTELNTPQHT